MKKSLLIALMLLTAGFSPLFADGYDDCCYSDSDWSLYADYLYWKVCKTGLRFDARDSSTDYVNPCYDSGWRIGGSYACDCWDLGIRYTSFDTTDSKTSIDGQQKYKLDWQVVDIEVGYALAFGCEQFLVRPFVGAKLAWIDESYDNRFDNLFSKQEFDGYGLYLGSELRYQFCMDLCGCTPFQFALVARGSYGILDGNSDTLLDSNDRAKECLFLSAIEVFAGLDIGYECGCFNPHLMIGYEANTLPGWREADSDANLAGLGVGGLVLRFAVDF